MAKPIFLMFFEGELTVFVCCWLPGLMLVATIAAVIYQSFQQVRNDKEVRLAGEREMTLRSEGERAERQEHLERLDRAMSEYFNCLEVLKMDPTNADQKQLTLALGRKYSEMSRTLSSLNPTVTIYDEVAVMNDIQACTGGSSVKELTLQNSRPTEERLSKLLDLKIAGLISHDEYKERRQKILDQI